MWGERGNKLKLKKCRLTSLAKVWTYCVNSLSSRPSRDEFVLAASISICISRLFVSSRCRNSFCSSSISCCLYRSSWSTAASCVAFSSASSRNRRLLTASCHCLTSAARSARCCLKTFAIKKEEKRVLFIIFIVKLKTSLCLVCTQMFAYLRLG